MRSAIAKTLATAGLITVSTLVVIPAEAAATSSTPEARVCRRVGVDPDGWHYNCLGTQVWCPPDSPCKLIFDLLSTEVP